MNILIVVADDLGWGQAGYQGGPVCTPAIDRLAADGQRMLNFFAQPVCSTTRAALITGVYSHRLGIPGMIWPWSAAGLPYEIPTLAELLKDSHQCYAIGKWHLGFYYDEMRPRHRGFDYHYGSYAGWMDHWTHQNNGIHDLFENDHPVRPEGHSTDVYTNAAINVLDQHDPARPFFMYLAYNAPHLPLQSVPYFAHPTAYAGLISHMDWCLGKVINVLQKRGLLADTLVWFTGDNGGDGAVPDNNGNWRGTKGSYFEGGLRIPNFVTYAPLGSGDNANVHHVTDIVPTVLDLLGKAPAGDGISIRNPVPDRTLIHGLAKNPSGSVVGCVRTGSWKLIRFEETFLFDLAADPTEKTNLAASRPDKVAELTAVLAAGDYRPPAPGNRWHPPDGFPAGFHKPPAWHRIREFNPNLLPMAPEIEEVTTVLESLAYQGYNP